MMNDVERKIFLEQIIALYRSRFDGTLISKRFKRSNMVPEGSINRHLDVFFSRRVDGKTLAKIAAEMKLSPGRVRQMEYKVEQRFKQILEHHNIKSMF